MIDAEIPPAVREEIVAVYRRLAELGLNAGSAGNVSCRTGDGMLITPTGATAETLEPGRLVPMELAGNWRGALRPSSEWAMHAAIYRRVPAAAAVVHTHADNCVALACLRKRLPPFHYMVAGFGGDDVPCVPYLPFGSIELGEAAAAALEQRSACLLANHGMIARGATLDAAVGITLRLETLARQYLLALSAGEPACLTDAEMAVVRETYRSYGQQTPTAPLSAAR